MRDHIRIREFLNLPGHHSVGYIYAVVPDSTTCDEPDCTHRWCGEFVLQIGDCSRSISLDFDLDDAESRRNSLHKLDLLIDTLHQFRSAVSIEADRAAAREGSSS